MDKIFIGIIYNTLENTNDKQDKKIEKLSKEKADYEIIKEMLRIQEKNFDRMYEEIKEILKSGLLI